MRHETEVRGMDEAFIRIRAIPGDVGRQMREIADEAAEAAVTIMLDKVPRSADTGSEERPGHRTIAQSIAVEKARFMPGGLGGGGSYEVAAGAIDNPPSHLGPVVDGSGFYSAVGNIKPYMGYTGNFFKSRQGQLPQREWADEGIDAANEVVETRIHTIRIDG